ncbi:putative carotenoid ester lipase precursor [Melampsora larici-populina 98AG31]|uniref:Putative carotenoid ester lipase n=1 Tax=Melampsora larici-populina (strain 98AG31 / pathotype 3-4-7) TaxID=747676 RepID=F4RSZ2_MELLP|nr:putative carotenoid ester lipase precursor [Melampsora larici-populina 98AG31]EGG04414.1 putative carotenoid ester lipase precursor [Melampsora larici-populina 98AG31]
MGKKIATVLVMGGALMACWYCSKSPTDSVNCTPISEPVVVLDYGSFRGRRSHLHHDIERFFGIPYAEPPVGDRRFTNPIPPLRNYGEHDARKHAPVCPQQSLGGDTVSKYKDWFNNLNLNPLEFFKPFGSGQEDCLTLDIARPAGLNENSKLPVMYFIYPGGFNYGASWQLSPVPMVKKSIDMGLPVIWVSANHRMNAFGFLGGREVGEAGVGNLGLKDQRLSMEWIQKHISKFGGDPEKVMIYGESCRSRSLDSKEGLINNLSILWNIQFLAGAISISHHLLAYNGNLNGLFRAAICQSGTALPAGKLSEGAGQKGFDFLVDKVGCKDSKDRLDCLRHADLKKLQDAINDLPGTFSFGAFPFTFGPSVDGEFITESMQLALAAGRFAKIPLISTNMKDEGTVLTISSSSIKTEDQLRETLQQKVPKASPEMIEKILQLWPSDPKLGSPFGTGDKNAVTPVYKQYSAILGDLAFQGLRRLFLRTTANVMPSWSLLDRAEENFPIIGAFHASDLPAVIGIIPGKRTDDYQARWISFAYNLDPNYEGLPRWEKYNNRQSLVMTKDGSIGMEPDNFREEEIEYYLQNLDKINFVSP